MLKLTALGSVALLTACANVQLPPWAGTARPAPPPSPEASASAAPAAPAVSQPVARTPQLAPLPYNPAIEARFPDPGTRYDTPGLADDRQPFTTQAEINDWLQSLSGKSGNGQHLDTVTIGNSQRGQPIQALIAAQAPNTQATTLNANGKPTILLVGQQRGNEPAGAEALLIITRELGRDGLLAPLLQRVNVIVVPRANPDAAETASPLTADGTDLIHDHLTLSTPEAQAIARLSRSYRPSVIIDLREFAAAGAFLQTFQAVQLYDVLVQPAASANTHEFVSKAAREWLAQPMRNALGQAGLSHEWYYETSNRPEDKSLSMASPAADTLDNASSLKNAAAVLVSSRGSDLGRLHIQRRVHGLVTAATSALRSTAEKAKNLSQVKSFVTRDIPSMACRNMLAVQAQQTPEQRTIGMLQADSGQELQAKVNWNSSLTLKTSQTRPRPCGYWLSAGSSQAVERLRLQGIQVMQIAESGQMMADSYQTQHSGGSSSLVLTRGAIDALMGSYYISLNQPSAHLVTAALEPDTPYSYVSKSLITTPADIARVLAAPSVVFEEEAE